MYPMLFYIHSRFYPFRFFSCYPEQPGASGHQPFTDPAIMSARFASGQDVGYQQADHSHLNYASPPGLAYPQGSANLPGILGMENNGTMNGEFLPCSSEEREDRVPSSRAFSVRKIYYRP